MAEELNVWTEEEQIDRDFSGFIGAGEQYQGLRFTDCRFNGADFAE